MTRPVARATAAAVAALVLAAAFGPLATPAGAAEEPSGVTVPATMRTAPNLGMVDSAGHTGFLHNSTVPNDFGLDWTTYDGQTRRVPGGDRLGAMDPIEYYGAASDVVAVKKSGTRDVVLRDMATDRTWTVTVPAGLTYYKTIGETVVAVGPRDADSRITDVHFLRADGATTVDRKMTGLPEGAAISAMGRASRSGFLPMLKLADSYDSAYAWVDLDSGRLELLPFGPTPTVTSGHVVVEAADGSGTQIYEQGRFDAPVRTLPGHYKDGDTGVLGVVGDALIVARWDSAYGAKTYGAAQWRVSAVPFDGSPERVLLARAIENRVAIRPDGGLVLVGGADAEHFGFTAVVADPAGGVRAELLHRIPPTPMAIQGLTLDRGRLSTVEYGNARTAVYTRELTQGSPGFGARVDQGGLARKPKCGATVPDCPALVPTGDGRTVYRGTDAQNKDALYVVDGNAYPGRALPLDFGAADSYYASVRVKAASGDLALVEQQGADGHWTEHVVDIDDGSTLHTEPMTPSALWGDTLWTAAATATGGKLSVTAKNARTGAKQAALTVGSGCTSPTDLQVVTRWLFWKCRTGGTPNYASGVVDLGTGRNVPVPVGDEQDTAALGDGFVVVGTAGTVRRYDVRGGTAVAEDLGKGSTPVVDPRTGDVAFRAWRDESGDWSDIRVVRGRAVASDLVATHSSVGATVSSGTTPVSWKGEWWLSEPAASSTVTFRSQATGRTVATRTGGAATRSVAAAWDGRGDSGAFLPNGAYTWNLSVRPADGEGPALTRTGTVRLTGGSPVRHDHIGATGPDGTGDLLTMNASGAFTFQPGTGAGGFATTGKVSASGWPTSTTAVPFGDLNGDRCNDVLVRVASGELRTYQPACGAALTPSTKYTKVGPGWNGYDNLVSPGDLTGDGRADLLARKISTGELFAYPGKSDGTLGTRTRIGAGWSGYTVIAAGDLDGDGIGDVVARRSDGTLFRYDGAGDGTLKSRTTMFSGWGNAYNVIVGAGDLTGDGRDDLVARDTSGNLYRYDGVAGGSFKPRVKIATGWNVYKGVF